MADVELTCTGIATAELMDQIRNARKDNLAQAVAASVSGNGVDTRVAAFVEATGDAIDANPDLATPEAKLNYACSAAALLISYTAELIKDLVEKQAGSKK